MFWRCSTVEGSCPPPLNVHRLNKHPSIHLSLLLYLSTSTTHLPHLGLILHRLPSEATPDHPLHPSNLSSEGHKRENEAIRSSDFPIGLPNLGLDIQSNLGHGKEENAHEFLRYAIDTLQSASLKEAGKKSSNSLETTLIGLTFGGYLRSKCMTCVLDSEKKYKCSKCKSYEKAKKELTLLEAPNVLTIALKRFQVEQYTMIDSSLGPPTEK
ncbi:unnamed protein product [Lactuca saligna]|uniref:Peptidase C19 ubiquitin carboxyl-terminal hydrolase domain-containing protein n=1 Tax=Lactuca saligna TaxID=75948 RepID=A0AA35ZPM8_LACSI|nr:unnamed protein product [Lactuca saligna]